MLKNIGRKKPSEYRQILTIPRSLIPTSTLSLCYSSPAELPIVSILLLRFFLSSSPRKVPHRYRFRITCLYQFFSPAGGRAGRKAVGVNLSTYIVWRSRRSPETFSASELDSPIHKALHHPHISELNPALLPLPFPSSLSFYSRVACPGPGRRSSCRSYRSSILVT